MHFFYYRRTDTSALRALASGVPNVKYLTFSTTENSLNV